MESVSIVDSLNAGQVWYVRSDGSAEIKGADDTTMGIELCREDVEDQASVFLEMTWVRADSNSRARGPHRIT